MVRRIALHVSFWLTYLGLKTYMGVFLINYSWFELDMGTRIIKSLMPELLVMPPKLLMAYTAMYFIMPRMTKINGWRLLAEAVGLVIASLLMYHLLLNYLIFPLVLKESFPESTFTQGVSRFIWRLLDMLAIAGVACTFKLLRQQANDAKREKQLIREKLQSELNFLRTQTNPHFLFNTLNSIYALARKQSPQTPEVVMQLSKLLRYMLYECQEPFVPLEKEWKVIEGYVSLEKLRYGERVNVVMKRDLNGSDPVIAPLLFLPLVENAFKHGAGKNRNHTDISVNLKTKDDQLEFCVENSYDASENPTNEEAGIGLQNVKRQLELLYPEHMMTTNALEGKYTVAITLNPNHDAVTMPDR